MEVHLSYCKCNQCCRGDQIGRGGAEGVVLAICMIPPLHILACVLRWYITHFVMDKACILSSVHAEAIMSIDM